MASTSQIGSGVLNVSRHVEEVVRWRPVTSS